MIKVKNVSVMNFENAIRGMRNAHQSWDKSDSGWEEGQMEFSYPNWYVGESEFAIGPNDLDLAQKLVKAGSDERKFLRQIFVSVDIIAPRFFWPEMDQYKVGTVTNSESTMHTLTSKPITKDDFSFSDLNEFYEVERLDDHINHVIHYCEYLRQKYVETKDKKYWRLLIESLPQSYNQMRTWTANYEVLRNIYHARKNHKLDCWRSFCEWIETLPYASELICN